MNKIITTLWPSTLVSRSALKAAAVAVNQAAPSIYRIASYHPRGKPEGKGCFSLGLRLDQIIPKSIRMGEEGAGGMIPAHIQPMSGVFFCSWPPLSTFTSFPPPPPPPPPSILISYSRGISSKFTMENENQPDLLKSHSQRISLHNALIDWW